MKLFQVFFLFFPPETRETKSLGTEYGKNLLKIKKKNKLSLRMENEFVLLE